MLSLDSNIRTDCVLVCSNVKLVNVLQSCNAYQVCIPSTGEQQPNLQPKPLTQKPIRLLTY